MTPEDLERMVALGDRVKLAAAVATLSEPERRKLSKTAQTLKRDIEQRQWHAAQNVPSSFERLKAFLGGKKVEIWEQLMAAELAILAVGPLSQAKKVHISTYHMRQGVDQNTVLKIMRDRRPAWIDDWIAAALAGDSLSVDWGTLSGLIKEGVCQKPTSEDYYRAMPQLLGWQIRAGTGEPIPTSSTTCEQCSLAMSASACASSVPASTARAAR